MEQQTECPHYMDNQGLCHCCGVVLDPYLWALYTGEIDDPVYT